MDEVLIAHDSWKRSSDGARLSKKIFKTAHGIRQVLFEDGISIMSTDSARPYKLGQSCDGTIDDCVHALFIKYCLSRGLDPAAIYGEAYGEREPGAVKIYREDIPVVLEAAEFQGVAYPLSWGPEEFAGLIESLTEINNHSLVQVVEEHYSLDARVRA